MYIYIYIYTCIILMVHVCCVYFSLSLSLYIYIHTRVYSALLPERDAAVRAVPVALRSPPGTRKRPRRCFMLFYCLFKSFPRNTSSTLGNYKNKWLFYFRCLKLGKRFLFYFFFFVVVKKQENRFLKIERNPLSDWNIEEIV